MGKNIGILKGLAHDLAWYLVDEIWFGKYKDNFSTNFETNIIEMKDYFDKEMLEFFKKRLPKTFNFNKAKKIIINIERSMTTLNIKIKINYDKKETEYQAKSSRV